MTGPVYCGPACSSAGNTSALMSPMRKAKIGSEDSSGASITKLSNLNPYSSVWEIEVTVLKIDPIREFKNGTGKLQNLTVCDDSGTILWDGLFLIFIDFLTCIIYTEQTPTPLSCE